MLGVVEGIGRGAVAGSIRPRALEAGRRSWGVVVSGVAGPWRGSEGPRQLIPHRRVIASRAAWAARAACLRRCSPAALQLCRSAASRNGSASKARGPSSPSSWPHLQARCMLPGPQQPGRSSCRV